MVTAADFANLSLLGPYAPLQSPAQDERRVVRVVFPGDADPARGEISVLEPLGVQLPWQVTR